MHIEPVVAADADAIVALWERAGLTRPWSDARADFLRAVDGTQSEVLKAVQDDAIIGGVMVGDDGHRGWIYYLAVEQSFRSAGIGKALVAAAEHWLRTRGQTHVRLMVRSENPAVLPFYESLGYDDRACVVLGRNLAG